MRIKEHSHCESCGDPVPFKEYFCSDACSDEYQKDMKEARRLDRRLYILMGCAIAAAAILSFLARTYIF
jgi:predicted nucleic acid-binding Zn ribbon protein